VRTGPGRSLRSAGTDWSVVVLREPVESPEVGPDLPERAPRRPRDSHAPAPGNPVPRGSRASANRTRSAAPRSARWPN
jgi:hypothetical protein